MYEIVPEGHQATKRAIHIGPQHVNSYEVPEGLNPGGLVIISSCDAFGGKDKLIFGK